MLRNPKIYLVPYPEDIKSIFYIYKKWFKKKERKHDCVTDKKKTERFLD
jgi:hypothetical protein